MRHPFALEEAGRKPALPVPTATKIGAVESGRSAGAEWQMFCISDVVVYEPNIPEVAVFQLAQDSELCATDPQLNDPGPNHVHRTAWRAACLNSSGA